MARRTVRLLFLIYLLVGIFVAYDRHYITVRLVKDVISAILAIVLWPLVVLLGTNVHIR